MRDSVTTKLGNAPDEEEIGRGCSQLLVSHIQKLEEENVSLRSALGHYASKDNWMQDTQSRASRERLARHGLEPRFDRWGPDEDGWTRAAAVLKVLKDKRGTSEPMPLLLDTDDGVRAVTIVDPRSVTWRALSDAVWLVEIRRPGGVLTHLKFECVGLNDLMLVDTHHGPDGGSMGG